MKSLSRLARLYLIFIYITGLFLLLRGLTGIKVSEPVLFIVLCVLGSILHILKVEGATNRSHYTFSFLIFGFALLRLDSQLALIVVVVSNLAEWAWNRPPWFIQLFNIACYVISAQIAVLVFTFLDPIQISTSWQVVFAIGAGMASFTFINHLIIGIVVWLARGENFKQSGIFDAAPLLIDLTMLSVGAGLALVWDYNPYSLLIFLAPAYPLYMALKIPALERQTELDQKTGLYNHQYFMNQLNNELQRANRYDRPFSIIIADLDLLRNINNTYGHLAGDDVLKGVADVLKQTVRDYDVVARFGGEEFAILMPETEIESAIKRAEHIRRTIESASFVIPTSVDPIKITMSFGVSKRESFDQSTEEIIHHADTALYRSKLSGRNRTVAYVNNSFLGADSMEVSPLVAENTSPAANASEEKTAPEYLAASSTYRKHTAETSDQTEEKVKLSNPQTDVSESSKKPGVSTLRVYNYILVLGLLAAGALFTVRHLIMNSIVMDLPSTWVGLSTIALLIIFTEWFSINLYVKHTSLSTSAVPIIALMILFGPLGTLVASTVFVITAAVKFRSPFNRIIFNFSNHILAGIVINLLFSVNTVDLGYEQSNLWKLGMVLAASLVLFISTTTLISIGIGIDQNQPAPKIWKEQYQWMIPYYIGIGFITFGLIFAYTYAGTFGILIMTIPLALLRFSQAQYVEHTRTTVSEIRVKSQELEKSALEINAMNDGLLTTLSEIIDLQDPHVLGHSKQVSHYATVIARSLGLNEKQIELVRKAGLLHDIGKLGIPKEILTKPDKLTPNEYEIIKRHSSLGSELVKNSPSLHALVPIIRHHHEFYNGEGYPDRLSGSQIPIEARIISVADAMEAMMSDRSYRKALKPQDIIEELTRHAGSQFDPLVVHEAAKILTHAVETENISASQIDSAKTAAQLKVNIQTS